MYIQLEKKMSWLELKHTLFEWSNCELLSQLFVVPVQLGMRQIVRNVIGVILLLRAWLHSDPCVIIC